MSETAPDVEARIPEGVDSAAAAETEVRPEELTQGIEEPIGSSAFSDEVVEELRKPLDPNRVRRRSGRGGSRFEYLAGHDVKRRANEIFGFGKWGHVVKSRELLEAVQVMSGEREGWHVGYATVVRIWVGDPVDGYYTEGVGYGDGVEYGPAARVQACELAIKESETDALKRAFTDLGDQFGLILYAKDDEKKRIQRDSQQPTGVVRVQEEAMTKAPPPKNWTEINAEIEKLEDSLMLGLADFWIPQAFTAKFGKPTAREMNKGDRELAGQKLAGVVSALWDLPDMPPPDRAQVQAVFATYFDGEALEGPPWRLAPTEEDRPTLAEYEAETANVGEQQDQLADEAGALAEEAITGPPEEKKTEEPKEEEEAK